MRTRPTLLALAALATTLVLWPLIRWISPAPLPPVATREPPQAPLAVFHLGHSLVGPEVPHMLAQLAPQGHLWNSQLGSGTALKEHWEPELAIRDFDTANSSPAYRDARSAIGSGEYDAVVLTEMVELRDALRYFDGADYFHRWADLARSSSPDTQIFLYETWHHLDDPAGWETRIAQDLAPLWLEKLTGKDSRATPDRAAYLIPAGQVMAAVARAAEAGEIDGLNARSDLFSRNDQGGIDTIHLNDLGAYVVALTHYSVLYLRPPLGLPHQLTRANGLPAQALSAQGAAEIQRIVWQVVQAQPRSGFAAKGGAQASADP